MDDQLARRVRRAADPVFTHRPWLSVYLDELDGGVGGTYVRLVEGEGRPGVCVLPLVGDQLGLVRVFRPAVGAWCLEAPRGFGETATPSEDAARELAEEAGIRLAPAGLLPLGVVQPNTGLSASSVHLFFAVVPPGTIGQHADTNEVASMIWLPLSEVFTRIRRGEIKDAFTQAALLQAMLAGLLPDTDLAQVPG